MRRPTGRSTSLTMWWCPLPIWPLSSLSVRVQLEGLLDLKNEERVVFLSLIWTGLSFSSFLLLSLSWSICPEGTDSSCPARAHLSPASNPPGITHHSFSGYFQPVWQLNPQVSAITYLTAFPCKSCFEGLMAKDTLQCSL